MRGTSPLGGRPPHAARSICSRHSGSGAGGAIISARLPFAKPSPGGGGLGPRRDLSGYAVEPGADRIAPTDGAGLAHQDQEGGLESILDRVRVRQDGAGRPQTIGPWSATKAVNAASASSFGWERNRSSS